MGLIATAKVVTRAKYYGRRSLLQPGNREWVTSIECTNASGWALPPCLIFKGKVFVRSWFEDPALPHDWQFELSLNRWMSDEIGLRWLQKLFIPSTTTRTKGKYQLLILDGHGSHLTPQFNRTCSQNDIIPICMPPHSSHLLQPLDIGCFAVLKRSYGRLVETKMRAGINHIDKLKFLEAYKVHIRFRVGSWAPYVSIIISLPYRPSRNLPIGGNDAVEKKKNKKQCRSKSSTVESTALTHRTSSVDIYLTIENSANLIINVRCAHYLAHPVVTKLMLLSEIDPRV